MYKNNLIKIDKLLLDKITLFPKNYYIDKEKELYIYNKNIFKKIISFYKIKFISIIKDKDYYYLISDTNVYKYINSKKILSYLSKRG